MTKKLLSIAALTALLSTGASAFDMKTDGTILADIVKHPNAYKANYHDGVNADTNLTLSSSRQGNALIYPAFRSGDDWTTEISLRNTKDVAIIAKAVLYAQSNSRELGDFNIYLSPHDAAKFTIHGNKVTSRDGSIAYGVSNPTDGVLNDGVQFADAKVDQPFTMEIPLKTKDGGAGYVIIYAMMQQSSANAQPTAAEGKIYHLKHKELFKDYRKTLDICRENDTNSSTSANWRQTFNLNPIRANVYNGTAVNSALSILAPNQTNACVSNASLFKGAWKRKSTFTSPEADALFGEVSISHEGEKRSILLPATALSNYVEPNKVMLWAEGEYAAIQDRRIDDKKYVPSDIKNDAETFLIKQTFFTFDKTNGDKNEATLLLTQPMKRALQMAGQGSTYWRASETDISSDEWGDFKLKRTPWTDDEGTYKPVKEETQYGSLNSPLDGTVPAKEPGGYQDEITSLNYKTLTEGFEDVFDNGEKAGYIDITIFNAAKAIPAIVTEMTSKDVDGECQINWIYSATAK